jgi:hypothetical protein
MACLRVRLFQRTPLHGYAQFGVLFLKLYDTIWVIQGHPCVSGTELGLERSFVRTGDDISSYMRSHILNT